MNTLILRGLTAGAVTALVLATVGLSLLTLKLEAQIAGCQAYTEKRFVRCTFQPGGTGVLSCEKRGEETVEQLIGVVAK